MKRELAWKYEEEIYLELVKMAGDLSEKIRKNVSLSMRRRGRKPKN